MKQLFIYNRLWIKQYLFFNHVNKCYEKYNKEENKYQIKYKRINYYNINEKTEVDFCIDKNYGRVNDYMIFTENGKAEDKNFI